MSTQHSVPIQTGYGIVKQVTSGDTIVLKGQPKKNGPPDEITIILTGILAPKLERRPTSTIQEVKKDEPYAWEAREFLRQKLIGKRVFFTYEKAKGEKSSTGGTREYGIVYNGSDANSENVAESLVSEGLASVRPEAPKNSEYIKKLSALEECAKNSAKGKHGPNANDHIRDIRWSIDNPQLFKDTYHQKPLKAVVEHVVDGSTVRVLLTSFEFSEYYYIKLMLSGIRCPGEDSNKLPEPFAEEAKYFTESRLLQRDVEVLLETVSNKNFLGTVLHPKGNITELLLAEGFAKCVDWSLQCVTSGIEKLRAAEKLAKEKRLRIWKEYTPSGPIIEAKEKEFQGKVVEIINADAMNVKLADGSVKKIFLASIRPPRLPENTQIKKPLYEAPYMFEAREFLRKKLIGKRVNVTVDYKQPANNNFPEKTCCTVSIGGINVAEALVSKGLATVVRYRADDDQRSAHYDELLSAEMKAAKSGKGLHSKKEAAVIRLVDLTGEHKNSKQYFPLIQRAGRVDAVVEFVASGSRLRLFLPRQNYLITFLLGGISCARASRDNGLIPGEPFGDEALTYTKDLCLQKEVQIEVESMDKGGNFIGWLWIDNINLSEALVQEGFAEVFAAAARSPYYRALQSAQEEAQKKKLRRWEAFEPTQPELKEDKSDRVVSFKLVTITETKDDATDLSFYAQHFDEGPKLEELMIELREEFKNSPPYPGNYLPTKNDICAAKYSTDNQWYRARILKSVKDGVLVSFIDFGNKETVLPAKLAALPAKYKSLPPCAHEYALAFVKLPKDADSASDARAAFFDETIQYSSLRLNVEYKDGSLSHVTLLTADEKEDIGKKLVEKGYTLVDRRPEKKFSKLISEYLSAQETAKKNRAILWQYGDITDDDAKEFG